MKGRRLLIITPSGRHLGGSEVMLSRFLASARREELATHVVFLEDGDHYRKILNAGYSCELIESGRLRDPKHWLQTCRSLAGIMRRKKFEAAVGWQAKAVAYAAFPARQAGLPFYCFHRGVPGRNAVDSISYLFPCDGYLANSSFTANTLRKYTRRPIAVVHSAVDITSFEAARIRQAAELKRHLGFDPNRPLVGIVGRLQRWKGMHVFIRAMARVLASRPDCQAVIVGGKHDLESSYTDFLERELRSLGVADHIRMAGRQTNIPEWMQAMDVFVHASEKEPFGLVVVEAMSLGKAVIASIPGGPAEIIRDGESGALVPHGDDRLMAKAIERFLQDADFAEACGREAKEAALTFDSAKYARNVLQAIDTLEMRRQNHIQP